MPKHNYTLNEIDIVYRPVRTMARRPVVDTPDKAHRIFRENWDSMKIGIVEEFKIMLLNRANRVLGIAPISLGGTAGTVVDPKVIFALAIKTGASGIIIAHNHPSGNLELSLQDIKLTSNIEAGGKLLGINLLDHIILSGVKKEFHSMTDKLEM